MQRPEVCSEQLYKLMRQCWSECPHDRPFFTEIVQRLESTERDEHIYVNFDDIAPNYVFPPTAVTEAEKNVIKPEPQPSVAPININILAGQS